MSVQEKLQISQIGQIAIPVQQLARAVAFYRDVLELQFLFEASNLAFFQCGEVRIMLSIPEGPENAKHGSVLYYKIDDIQQSYQRLRQRGAKAVDEPHLVAKLPDHDLWMVFFEDTEGNMLALMSEVRPG